ncbi:hypothetical protein ONS95_007917 [Cadophora gregata]|uniref:uncharacterized protein n=1 Tax=Cadophora gregata TaxID=51156 RepID=UPI0026DD604E|nr:uncharacterized protein ONS95_007917 [Cadophora gregata]KAK0126307.1 hypothetical protein ONS95_007917 [Cadophora gregata]
MAITALPDATVHLLGSAQALTTPTSLVKELIDNALDAKASSIDIVISPNTIDKIEVRDNGQGIPQEDLDALGRRGHTSKLRSFEELKSIGGISLGFRGEALASAVQLGLVSVTTRTEGETVATSVQLKAPGGIASQSRTSHPVGTKISVTKFLYNLPVRRQTALKDSAKTLKRIKELLYSYAFARPRVRFCMRVASGGKGSWSFTPRPNDGMKEVASKIIGRDAAAQCIEKSLAFSEKTSISHTSKDASKAAQISNSTESGSDEFTVEVFMPKPEATSMGHGQYISVDSRPVTHDKGTMKKLVSIFKYYAKGSGLEGEEKPKDPFLRLNIKCPISSYDPNVEPAKDDVIFQDESLVLESVEQLFKNVYGVPLASTITGTPEKLAVGTNNFELLMSRNQSSGKHGSSSEHVHAVEPLEIMAPQNLTQDLASKIDGELVPTTNETAELERIEGQNWSVDMSQDFSEDVEGGRWSNRSSQNLRRLPQPSSDGPESPGNSLNPWIISKMNAPIPPKNIYIPHSSAIAVLDDTPPQPTLTCLPTPQHSSDPVIPDVEPTFKTPRPHQIVDRDGSQSFDLGQISSSSQEPQRGPEDIVFATTFKIPTIIDSDVRLLGDDVGVLSRNTDFNTARDILNGPSQKFPQHSGSTKPKRVNKPFVPPMRAAGHDMQQDGLRQTVLTGGTIRSPSARSGHTPNSLDPDQNDELAWAMDFEHRKEDATRQRRKEILAARAEAEAEVSTPVVKRRRLNLQDEDLEVDLAHEIVRSSPHKNRYNAAIANLEAGKKVAPRDDFAKPSFKTSLPDGDPRAYLMRRRKSMEPSVPGGPMRPMRAKSTRLPLEKIPDAEMLHRLVLRYPVDLSAVQSALDKSKVHDVYVNEGSQAVGLSMESCDAKLVVERIQAAVKKWMKKYPGKAYDAEYTFDGLVNVR